MPELPEVEVTRRTIAQSLQGATVRQVRLGKPLRWPLGCTPQSLAGRVIGEVSRRGKYLWMPLGPRPGCAAADAGGLLLHLGMSGSLSLMPPAASGRPQAPSGLHDHFEMDTSAGTLRLRDPRRFGAVLWSASVDSPPAATLLQRLGPEPFDPALTPQSFHAALQRHRGAIKTVILSGTAMVGAGNIYACEALFRAGIDPRVASHRISRPRATRLLAALRETLAQAIGLGGSTLRDFRDAHGMDGAYQAHAGVYGREGQPCPTCGATVKRIVQAQRATFFCPRCQKR